MLIQCRGCSAMSWVLPLLFCLQSGQVFSGSVDISDLLARLDDNPALDAKDAAVRSAAADTQVMESLGTPRLTADALSPVTGQTTTSEPEYTMRAEQSLYDWGVNSSRVKGAEARLEAARLSREQTLMDLSVVVSDAFHRLGAGFLQLRVLGEARLSLDELSDMMSRRVEQRVSPQVDLEIVQSQVALQDVQTEQLRREIRRHQLTILRATKVLVDDADMSGCSLDVEADEQRWVSRALGSSPDLSTFDSMVSVHVAEQDAIRAEGYPAIIGGYQVDTDLDGDNFDQRGYLALRFGLQLGSNMEARLASERAKELERRSLRVERAETIAQETGDLIAEYNASRRLSNIQSRLVGSRATQRQSYLRRFVAGRASWNDVLNAGREHTEARLAEVSARTMACRALSLLSITTGSGRPYAVD